MIKEMLDGDYIFVIRNFLAAEECAAFVTQSEHSGYEEATITTAAGLVMNKDARDKARVILDDTDLAARLWQRAEPILPGRLRNWQAVGFNERFRFYR